MEKCFEEQNEQTEAEEPWKVTTEQQHVRKETQSDEEKQAEKKVIHITNESTVDQPGKAVLSKFDRIWIEKCFEELKEQTKAEEPWEVTTEQQHMRKVKESDTEKQAEKEVIHITNESTVEQSEKSVVCDFDRAWMEKCFEGLNEQTEAEEPWEVTTEQHHKKKEQSEPKTAFELTNEDTNGLIDCGKDDTDNVFKCKAKENAHLKSKSTKKRESLNTAPKTQEDEHIYEVPDVVLTNSVEHNYETECIKEQLKHLDNVTLHIAVTGSTGAGKSTFINAIRGLKPDDVGAAPTGVTETTVTSTVYPHPTMPNVKLWDLPGTGSPKFKAKNYLKEVKLDTFDFFIIISSERFKENDIVLAKAIKEKKKLFYFLRSKIDNDIEAESQWRDFDEEKVLSQIREDCYINLKDMHNPEIFLISSFELHKYDFQTLVDTLEKQLPAHKRDALVLSLPIYSSKILEEKIEMFMKQTWSAAVASGSIAVAPVPGLSIACDAAILLAFFTKCYYAFGLDDESIDKLSVRVNNPSLKSVRKSPLVIAVRQKKLSNKELSALTSKEAAVKFAWSMVPVVGSKKTAEMSYSATLGLLRAGVQDLADTAKEVLKVAGLTDVY
ncbi:interferon-inducible GTPase 5-like protein [Labeo rohita]|uniref:Interferon-inducible GTPase 5-like protein n=2 Tax=Labeo rohita TaxID=84645 RepID=A0A498LSY2_LABRO|nr:interferon-inducible GTPase 5-like protein [Labeo rohita]RXN30438.1 interferon-inducible GTPase 5-like protein [Labeo rohita]